MSKRGRPRKECPEGVNPYAGTLAAIAERTGVCVATVSRWRKEAPELKPAKRERVKAPRPPFSERLERQRPGAVAACQSDMSHADVARIFGVTGEAVRQWRDKLCDS